MSKVVSVELLLDWIGKYQKSLYTQQTDYYHCVVNPDMLRLAIQTGRLSPASPPGVVEAVLSLFDKIKHGDQAHQDWLKNAIDDHFKAALTAEARSPWMPVSKERMLAALEEYCRDSDLDPGREIDELAEFIANRLNAPQDHCKHDYGVDAVGDIVRCQTCGVPRALVEESRKPDAPSGGEES